MKEYPKHLYMIVFPINALVASQLEPDKFGEHYTIGSAKHFSGKVIFAEIDINYRNDYFDIESYLTRTLAHEDGGPKKTKFVGSYNVLENIHLSAIQKLYLCTTNGKVLPLEAKEFKPITKPNMIRLYQEVTPLDNFIACNLDHFEFGKYITTESVSKGAPKLCFTQIDFDIEQFLEIHKNKDVFNIELPNVNPYRFYDCIMELKENPEKKTKTISLGGILGDISYKLLRHGFWFIGGDESKFFPMPSEAELEDKYYYWWKYIR